MKQIKYKAANVCILSTCLVLFVFISISCKKYLDEKTDKKLVIPSTLQDAQAMMDFYGLFNTFYPAIGNIADDNFYLKDSYYTGMNITNRNNYVWAKEAVNEIDWSYLYQKVLSCNIALETLEKIQPEANTINTWKSIKGAALFYRAYAFYHLAQYYAEPYDRSVAAQRPGIVIRLSSNLNIVSKRSSMEDSWQEIIAELKEAAALLPAANSPASRPAKPAAFAALARIFLCMHNYDMAGRYADSSLSLYNTLLDFNTLNPAAPNPFSRFNAEVVMPTVILGLSPLISTNYIVDSSLYQSYNINDLRRSIYFTSNGTGTFGFRGSYDGNTNADAFNGIAVDEIYLIRAEYRARTGDKDAALADLNTLLKKRWRTGFFVPFTAANGTEALDLILTERRKELVQRSTRWFDLRRLNKEPQFQKTLIRKINGVTYQLPPNDSRYTFLIPQSVIDISGMQQNIR